MSATRCQKFGLEGIVAAEIGANLGRKRTRGFAATIGLDAVPIEAVIPGLGGIVEQTSFTRIASNGLNHIFDRLVIVVGALDGIVVLADIASVVLIVVKFKGLLGNVGL